MPAGYDAQVWSQSIRSSAFHWPPAVYSPASELSRGSLQLPFMPHSGVEHQSSSDVGKTTVNHLRLRYTTVCLWVSRERKGSVGERSGVFCCLWTMETITKDAARREHHQCVSLTCYRALRHTQQRRIHIWWGWNWGLFCYKAVNGIWNAKPDWKS